MTAVTMPASTTPAVLALSPAQANHFQHNFNKYVTKKVKEQKISEKSADFMMRRFKEDFAHVSPASYKKAEKSFKSWLKGSSKYIGEKRQKKIVRTAKKLFEKTLQGAKTPKTLENIFKSAGVSKSSPLYKFFSDKDFVYSSKQFDLGIEQFFGVLFIDPKMNRQDDQFLQSLKAKYPNEISTMQSKRKQSGAVKGHPGNPFISLQHSTGFANNEIAETLAKFKDDKGVLNVVKEILKYCILQSKH